MEPKPVNEALKLKRLAGLGRVEPVATAEGAAKTYKRLSVLDMIKDDPFVRDCIESLAEVNALAASTPEELPLVAVVHHNELAREAAADILKEGRHK